MRLIITDGTDTINLLNEHGFMLKDWTPIRPLKKSGGVWQNSPVYDNSKLVLRNYDNIIDVLTLTVKSKSMNATIYESRRLAKLLEKAEQYWTTDWQNQPVWIERQGSCETNIGYAVIRAYQWEHDDNPFQAPFSNDSLMDEIDIVIQHGFWRAQKPKEAKCIEISGKQYAVTIDETSETPGNSADDVILYTQGNGVNYFSTTVAPDVGARVTYQDCNYYVRFPNVAIPNGSEILNAYMTLKAKSPLGTLYTSYSTSGCNLLLKPYCSGNAPQIANQSDFIANKLAFDENAFFVEWNEVEEWTYGNTYNTPNISSIIQGTVNRSDFASGNAIGMFIANNWLLNPSNPDIDWTHHQDINIQYALGNRWYGVTAAKATAGAQAYGAVNNGGRLYTSHDDGDTWTERRPAGDVDYQWRTIAMDTDGSHILAGGYPARAWRSTNSGATWTEAQPAGAVDANWRCSGMSSTDGQYMYIGAYNGRLWRSADYGATWNDPIGTDLWWTSVDVSDNGALVIACAAYDKVYYSTDSGVTFNNITPPGAITGNWASVSVEVGYLYAAERGGAVWYSADAGVTWNQLYPSGNKVEDWAFVKGGSWGIVAATDKKIYQSEQAYGTDWGERKPGFSPRFTIYSLGVSYNGDKIIVGTEYIQSEVSDNYYGVATTDQKDAYRGFEDYNGVDDPILYVKFIDTTTEYGRDETCENEVFVANKQDYTQLTDIYIYEDGVGFDAHNYATDSAYSLLPNPASSGDMIYFGVSSAGLNPLSPFSNIVFDIDQPADIVWEYAWEYYNGVAWVAMPTIDDGTNGFSNVGVVSIGFDQPADWATVAVNGVTGYWIRFNADTITSFTDEPTQQNRYVYTAEWSYFEIGDDQIEGDYSAQAAIKVDIANTSLGLGSEDTIERAISKLYISSRSLSRGEDFTPYFNFSTDGTHNPGMIALTIYGLWGTTPTIIDASDSGTGDALREVMPAGSHDIARFTVTPEKTRQYIGKFRVFVRARQTAGDDNDVSMYVTFDTSKRPSIVTQTIEFPGIRSDDKWVLIDFGTINTDTEVLRATSDDNIGIALHIYAENGSTIEIMDLILLPIDETYYDIEMVDRYSDLSEKEMLIRDSVFIDNLLERRNIPTAIDTYWGTGILNGSPYFGYRDLRTISAKPLEFQAEEKQRVYLLGAYWDLDDKVYYSIPEILYRVQTACVERYLGMIGD